jgi:hypothetical protein
MTTSTRAITLALYRDLWRACGPAVNYSGPELRTIRSTLRKAFKDMQNVSDPITREMLLERGENTLRFLRAAAHASSQEHKLVKNIAKITMFRQGYAERSPVRHKLNEKQKKIHDDVYAAFERTLAVINETYQLGLQ